MMKKSFIYSLLPLLFACQSWAGATVNSSMVCRSYVKNPIPDPSYDPNTGKLVTPPPQSRYSYQDVQLNLSQVDFDTSDPTTLNLENQMSLDPSQPILLTAVSIRFPSVAEAALAKTKLEKGGMKLFWSGPSLSHNELYFPNSPCESITGDGYYPQTLSSSELLVINSSGKKSDRATPLDSFLGAPPAGFSAFLGNLTNKLQQYRVLTEARRGNQDPRIISELSKDVQTFPPADATSASPTYVTDAAQ